MPLLMVISCALVAFALLPQASAHGWIKVDPDAPNNNISYFGRFEFDQDGTAHHGWNGAYIKANFDGTSISATMKTTNGIGVAWDVIVDGAPPIIVINKLSSSGDGFETVNLASGLAPGVHSIELRKRSETRSSADAFRGFIVVGGSGLLQPAPTPKLAIEFYGDSWLAGYGAGYATSRSLTPPHITNGADSFGPVAARAMGAEYHLQAYGGMSWSGGEGRIGKWSFPRGINAYDTKRWHPDVVVVDMGRNDNHACCLGDYHSFISWLQSSYGRSVPIVICAQDNHTFYHTVYDLERASGGNVFIWTNFLFSDMSGDMVNGHPSKSAHERFAKKLQLFLETEVLPPSPTPPSPAPPGPTPPSPHVTLVVV